MAVTIRSHDPVEPVVVEDQYRTSANGFADEACPLFFQAQALVLSLNAAYSQSRGRLRHSCIKGVQREIGSNV